MCIRSIRNYKYDSNLLIVSNTYCWSLQCMYALWLLGIQAHRVYDTSSLFLRLRPTTSAIVIQWIVKSISMSSSQPVAYDICNSRWMFMRFKNRREFHIKPAELSNIVWNFMLTWDYELWTISGQSITYAVLAARFNYIGCMIFSSFSLDLQLL